MFPGGSDRFLGKWLISNFGPDVPLVLTLGRCSADNQGMKQRDVWLL